MATTVIGDLVLRAALDISDMHRGFNQAQRMIENFPRHMAGAMGEINVVPANMQQQGAEIAEQLALGIERDRQRVAEALEGGVTEAVRDMAQAAQEAATATAPAAAAMEEVTAANERAAEAMQARADAERASAAAMAEQASVSQEAARNARAWGESVREATQSVAEIQRDLEMVNAAVERGDASLEDYAAALEEARRQADLLGIAGGSKLARELSRSEMALVRMREAAQSTASAAPAMNATAAAAANVDRRLHGAAFGASRVNVTLASLLRQILQVNPAVSQLGNVIGTLAIGSTAMVGVLAGLAAVSMAWSRYTSDTREAKRETEEMLDRLRELSRLRGLPVGGQMQVDVEEARQDIADLRAQLQNLEGMRQSLLEGGAGLGAPTALGDLQRMIDRRRKQLDELVGLERDGTDALLEAAEERERRLRAQEVSALSSLISMGAATQEEFQRAQEMIREETRRLQETRERQAAQLEEPLMVFFNPLGGAGDLFGGREAPSFSDLASDAADAARNVNTLQTAMQNTNRQVETAAERAARLLQQEVSALSEAQRLGQLRLPDIRRAVQLEQDLRRQIEAGTLSLEARIRTARQLEQLQSFSLQRAPDASITVPRADVIIGGVRIENPEEMAQMYRDQVQARLDRERLTQQLNLTIQPTPERDEMQRRRAAMQAAQEVTAAFNESVQAGNEVLRAFGDLAEATDALGAGFSQVLSSVQTFAEGLQRMRYGQTLSAVGQTTMGTLAQISGWVSIAAGAIGFIEGLFAQSQAQREHADAVRRATEAVSRFRLELSGFRPDTAEARLSVRGAIVGGREELERIRIRGEMWGSNRSRVAGWVDELLRGFGVTLEQVMAVAESLNIPLLDASGNLVVQNLYALAESITDANRAMVGFRNTLDDRQQERQLRDQILGIDRTPQMQAEAIFGDLHALAPQMFEAFFSGLDMSDVGAVRLALLAILDAFARGGEQFVGLMEGLNRDTFLQWLGQAADALERMDEVTRNATGALLGVPQGFRILNLELERFNAMQRRRAEEVDQRPEPPPAPAPPAAPEPPRRPEPRQPERPDGRGPIQPWEREPQVLYEDHRTYSFEVVQRPDEDGEDFVRRVTEIVRRKEDEDRLVYGPGGRI